MNSILDLIWARIPPINYVSPPICPIEFSASSGPVVMVSFPALPKVTGVKIVDCILTWDALAGECTGSCTPALCYNIYRAEANSNDFEVVAECVQNTSYPVADNACYKVSAITTEGESDLSDTVCADCGDVPPPPPPPPEEFESEIWYSINGALFALGTTLQGESPNDPVLFLEIDSTVNQIKLNWGLDQPSGGGPFPGDGFDPGDVWCFKVRGSVPTVGNFSNIACAVRDMIYPGVGVVNYPTWQLAFGDLVSDDSTLVTDLDFSGLRAVIDGSFFMDASFALNSIDLSSLVKVDGSIHFSVTALTSLSLPLLTALGEDLFCDNTSLVNVSIPGLVMLNGKTYAFDSSALNAASVEGILARGIASSVTSATIRLDGGTNAGLASLSAQGQADYAALVLAGNTVTINP